MRRVAGILQPAAAVLLPLWHCHLSRDPGLGTGGGGRGRYGFVQEYAW